MDVAEMLAGHEQRIAHLETVASWLTWLVLGLSVGCLGMSMAVVKLTGKKSD